MSVHALVLIVVPEDDETVAQFFPRGEDALLAILILLGLETLEFDLC
jgi:hypothetical protein